MQEIRETMGYVNGRGETFKGWCKKWSPNGVMKEKVIREKYTEAREHKGGILEEQKEKMGKKKGRTQESD